MAQIVSDAELHDMFSPRVPRLGSSELRDPGVVF